MQSFNGIKLENAEQDRTNSTMHCGRGNKVKVIKSYVIIS